jgi:hypothetical protein
MQININLSILVRALLEIIINLWLHYQFRKQFLSSTMLIKIRKCESYFLNLLKIINKIRTLLRLLELITIFGNSTIYSLKKWREQER